MMHIWSIVTVVLQYGVFATHRITRNRNGPPCDWLKEKAPLLRGKVIHLIDVGIHMGILDKLARSGSGALGAESWAELDNGARFWMVLLIMGMIFLVTCIVFVYLSWAALSCLDWNCSN